MKAIYLFVVYVCLAVILDLAMTETIYAQDAASSAAAVQAQAAVPAPSAIVAPATPQTPALIAIPEPAAPPSWATDLLTNVAKFPVIGPYLSKALLYLGILAAILTTLVGAALSILATLKSGFDAAGLDKAADAITNFKNGKFMYYLVYFSNFNAKKPIA